MSKIVRAKMRLHNINNSHGNVNLNFGAVYSDDPNSENKAFSDATPAASLNLNIQENKPAAGGWESGKCYYIDITVAPE